MNRRRFLKATATSAGGLMVAFHLPALGNARPFDGVDLAGEINAWLVIDPDDTVTIRVAQSEMGEGVFTSLPMIVADELGADWSMVRAEYADANRSLREDRVYDRMATGGSNAIRHSRPYLQAAGANARERLVRAAASRWGVDPAECTAADSRVSHGGKELRYGELAAEAAAIEVGDVQIKTPDQFTLIGTPQRRLDSPAKVDGSAVFGMDVRVPDMVYAAVAHCPVMGGKVRSFDFSKIADRAGVVQAVELDGAVAVVAEHYWQARTALDALPVEWDRGVGAGTSSAEWEREFAAALDGDGAVAHEQGDTGAAFADAASTIEADYSAPYLAHACMEPLNCTAHVQEDRVDVWTGAQNPESVLAVGAEAAGVEPQNVYPHTCFLGGGFGRRSNPDFVREAVLAAKAVGRPVQLIWSREEDTRGGRYRPMTALRFKAAFDADRKPVGWSNHSVTHSILAGLRPEMVASGVDRTSVEGLEEIPYAIPSQRVTHTIRNTHLSTWFWRSVGNSQNPFARECFVDEMAAHAGVDPLAFRRSLIGEEHADMRHVLAVLEERSGWGGALPAGTGRGMAIHESFGSIVGQVAEVSVSKAGAVKVERVVSAVDCGHLVNPLSAEAQIESCIVYGLTAALYGKLTVEDGAVVESNFHDYPMLHMADTPKMETHFALSGGDKWGGIGEPGLPPLAPAVCNAIFAVTGKRVRSLPLSEHDLSWS